MWTVQDAKAKLSQVLQRARSGDAQIIGAQEPCVVVSLAEYERLKRGSNSPHLGQWLVENAPRVGDIDLPPRTSDRPVPFDDWSEEDFAK
jgi:prevent-host-death family protein